MSAPPPGWTPNWTTPEPPRDPRTAIRGSRVAAGAGIALAVQAVPALLAAIAIGAGGTDTSGLMLAGLVGLEIVVFVACLVAAIIFSVRSDRGIGVGLLIGWAIGALVLPVAGFGMCVWAINNSSSLGLGLG